MAGTTDYFNDAFNSGVADKNKPQRQDSLDEQLRDLAAVADREGMYDAADWIKEQLNGR